MQLFAEAWARVQVGANRKLIVSAGAHREQRPLPAPAMREGLDPCFVIIAGSFRPATIG